MFQRFILLLQCLSILSSCGSKSAPPTSDLDSVGGVFKPIPGDSAPARPIVAVWKDGEGEGEGENALYSASLCTALAVAPESGRCTDPIKEIVKQMNRIDFKNLLFSKLESWALPSIDLHMEIASVVKSFIVFKAWSEKDEVEKTMSDLQKKVADQKRFLGEEILTDPDLAGSVDVLNFRESASQLADLERKQNAIHGVVTAIETGFDEFLERVDSNEVKAVKVNSPFESYVSLFLVILGLTPIEIHLDGVPSECKGGQFNEGFSWITCPSEGTNGKFFLVNNHGKIIYATSENVNWVEDFSDGLAIVNLPESNRVLIIDQNGKVVGNRTNIRVVEPFRNGVTIAKTGLFNPAGYFVDKNLDPIPGFGPKEKAFNLKVPSLSSKVGIYGMQLTEGGPWQYLKPDMSIQYGVTDKVGNFYNGRALSWNPASQIIEVIDSDWKIQKSIPIPFKIDRVDFAENIGFVRENSDHGRWALLTQAGLSEVTLKTLPSNVMLCENGWYRWWFEEKSRLLDPKNFEALHLEGNIEPIGCFSKENLAPVKIGDKYSYITTSGELAWGGQKVFTKVAGFSDGLSYVETETERGYISSIGEFYLVF